MAAFAQASPQEIANMDKLFSETAGRLFPLVDVSKLKKRGTVDGIDVFAKPSEKESVFRTGQLLMRQPPKVVAELFGNWNKFKDFDSKNTIDSKELSRYSPARTMAWFMSKPKAIISSRDFVVMSERKDMTDGSIIFVQYSVPKAMKETSNAVRGDIWTLMYIQPAPEGCICTYVVEVQPHGWLPTKAVDMAADDIPAVLAGLKQALNA